MPTATATGTVTVLPVATATATGSVTITAPQSATATGSVTVLPPGALTLTRDKATAIAGEVVTFTAAGTVTSWSADNGAVLTGSGNVRTLVAPAYADTTVVTVTITGTGGPKTAAVTVKGQPAIYRGGSWAPTTVQR